jgi:putative sugar O-methyltransferase
MKNILKQFAPPIFLNFLRKLIAKNQSNQYSNSNFLAWWKKFKSNSKLDSDVIEMVDAFTKSAAFDGMSRYWNYLNKKNLEQLSEVGFGNFKQTISANYYTWINGISGTLGANLIKDAHLYTRAVPISEITKIHDYFDIEQSVLFNTMTCLLYSYIEKQYPELIGFCEESTIGNAPSIEIDGRQVSQDALNSAIEYASIVRGRGKHPSSVLEIGAGSGRDAEFFLRKEVGNKHVICDIVPALFISQKYLSEVFKDRKIFKFREFTSFAEVAREFNNCEIAFVMPHQLRLLPEKYFDTCLAIDCLHEMREDQISEYFSAGDRLADYFYFKAWNKTTVPFDGITLTKSKYRTPSNWQNIFLRDCYIPSEFFEAMYRCN